MKLWYHCRSKMKMIGYLYWFICMNLQYQLAVCFDGSLSYSLMQFFVIIGLFKMQQLFGRAISLASSLENSPNESKNENSQYCNEFSRKSLILFWYDMLTLGVQQQLIIRSGGIPNGNNLSWWGICLCASWFNA